MSTSIPTITRLQVRNYRGLADVDIHLGPLTVLVGLNGAGKSSLIDVLRFVRDIVTRSLDAAVLDRHGMSAIRRWSAKGAPYDVHINLHLQGNYWHGEYGFTLGSEKRGDYRIKAERISVVPDDNRGRNQVFNIEGPLDISIKEGKVINHPKELDSLFSSGLSSFFDSTSLFFPRIAQLFPFEGLFEMYRFFSEMSFYTIYPDKLREPQKPSNPHPLEEDGQNLASVLRNLKQKKDSDINTITTALERVVEGVYDYTVTQVGGYLVTRLHHDTPDAGRRGPAFELSQESDGTLRMLGILTALYQDPPRSLVTIEEPELTIHPGALGVLCDVIQEASLHSQVLTTTHNPDLLDRFSEATLLVVEKEGGITNVGPLSYSQKEAIAKKLFSPGELMRIQGLHLDQ